MASTAIESSGLNLWIRERRFTRSMRLANASHDAFILSVPKSGRTWHRVLMGHYLARSINQDPKNALDIETLCKMAGIRRLGYSHNCASSVGKLPPKSLVVASPVEWQNRHVMILVRDLRDVLVSSYFDDRYRFGYFSGSISEFVRNPFIGAEKFLTALNRWHENRHLAASFETISYEQMHADPALILEKSLQFIGVATPDPKIIQESVEFASFKNLRRLQDADYFQSGIIQSSQDPRAQKVRSGKVGGFREHLSEDDLEFISGMEKRMGNPFAALNS